MAAAEDRESWTGQRQRRKSEKEGCRAPFLKGYCWKFHDRQTRRSHAVSCRTEVMSFVPETVLLVNQRVDTSTLIWRVAPNIKVKGAGKEALCMTRLTGQ